METPSWKSTGKVESGPEATRTCTVTYLGLSSLGDPVDTSKLRTPLRIVSAEPDRLAPTGP